MIPGPDGRLTKEYLDHLEEAVNAPINPVIYLGIDPGKSNGVCGYDAKYYLAFMMTINSNDIVQFLQKFKNVKKCIMEGYSVYPNKAKDHIYSDLETPRVIGRIESWSELNDVELIKQNASIKATGYLWIGQKPLPKSNKQNHMMDAHVHAMYYFIKNRLVSASKLLGKEK